MVRKKKQKVGTTRITVRKINGQRRTVEIKKVSKKKYKIRLIGKKIKHYSLP